MNRLIANNAITVKNDTACFIVYNKLVLSDGINELNFYPETLSPFSNKLMEKSTVFTAFNLEALSMNFDCIDDGVVKNKQSLVKVK